MLMLAWRFSMPRNHREEASAQRSTRLQLEPGQLKSLDNLKMARSMTARCSAR